MTKQEVFDKVATHLLRQNKQAGNDEVCLYRTNDGLKCAVGCLIPDDVYDPEIEWLGADKLPERIYDAIGFHDGDFLCGLQRIHDKYPSWSWPAFLKDFANDNGLDASCLST